MIDSFFKKISLAVVLSVTTTIVIAQEVKEPKPFTEDWTKPFPPFRIAGNLYYVGTYDLACYLIVTSKGNILINTGLAASTEQIKNNIKTLGFRFEDTKILLTTQAHFDHMGAMAQIKKETGAKFMVDEKDAAVAKDGGSSDYALGGNGMAYAPVMPDRLLNDGDTISLGNMKVVMLHHPGHTKGSCSFLFTVTDKQRSWKVLIANLPTIVTDKPFASITDYPEVANDYSYTFKTMKALTFDIWLSSHASQFNMHSKHKYGDAYNPSAFIDRAGYDAQLNDLQKKFEEKLKQ